MKYNFNVVQSFVILLACSIKLSSGNQPSYQVSIYVHHHPQKPPIHACNGVIVQSRLILTTASCVHYKTSANGTAVVLEPSKISVISGKSTIYHEELALHVANIFVANQFNYTTGRNDLALLRLSSILQLDTRNDISWITLEDDKKYNEPCMASFIERNSSNGTLSYIQSEQLPILDAESCRVVSEKLTPRKHDICSLYYLPTDVNCTALKNLQNYSDDRGTGLVCGNKLIGLLSNILPWQNASHCKEKPLKAYYTAVVPHISWIFKIITSEDLQMYNEGKYISSSPYAGKTNAFIKPNATETVTSTIQTTPVSIQTTKAVPHRNSATTLNGINCKLLYGILGIFYLTGHVFNWCSF